MRKEDFCEILSEINEKHIEDARTDCKTKKITWLKWGAVAACLCLMVGLAIHMASHPPVNTPNDTMSPGDGPSSLTVNGVQYLISPHLSVSNELPDGFIYTGEAVVGGVEACPYYTNPEMPEWVYVYHVVLTDGTVDETGILNRVEPHYAYVRYVDVRLRGKDIVCYNGEYYISMWSAEYYGDNPDVTREYYEKMDALYGKRIEGVLPNGLELAGTAMFTGNDTIPVGYLASNETSAAVYYDPNDPAAIFVETHWFTATEEENGQTRHDGFNVYIRYDCPFGSETEPIQIQEQQ